MQWMSVLFGFFLLVGLRMRRDQPIPGRLILGAVLVTLAVVLIRMP